GRREPGAARSTAEACGGGWRFRGSRWRRARARGAGASGPRSSSPSSSASASPRGDSLLLFVLPAQRPPQTQREQAEQRGAAAELGAVLAVECCGVSGRLLGARVLLRAARAAAALACPAHRRPVRLEAVPVPEEPAAQHEIERNRLSPVPVDEWSMSSQ